MVGFSVHPSKREVKERQLELINGEIKVVSVDKNGKVRYIDKAETYHWFDSEKEAWAFVKKLTTERTIKLKEQLVAEEDFLQNLIHEGH